MCVSLYDLRSFSDDLGLALGRLQSNLGMIQGKLGITLGKHIYTPLSLCVYPIYSLLTAYSLFPMPPFPTYCLLPIPYSPLPPLLPVHI